MLDRYVWKLNNVLNDVHVHVGVRVLHAELVHVDSQVIDEHLDVHMLERYAIDKHVHHA